MHNELLSKPTQDSYRSCLWCDVLATVLAMFEKETNKKIGKQYVFFWLFFFSYKLCVYFNKFLLKHICRLCGVVIMLPAGGRIISLENQVETQVCE